MVYCIALQYFLKFLWLNNFYFLPYFCLWHKLSLCSLSFQPILCRSLQPFFKIRIIALRRFDLYIIEAVRVPEYPVYLILESVPVKGQSPVFTLIVSALQGLTNDEVLEAAPLLRSLANFHVRACLYVSDNQHSDNYFKNISRECLVYWLKALPLHPQSESALVVKQVKRLVF